MIKGTMCPKCWKYYEYPAKQITIPPCPKCGESDQADQSHTEPVKKESNED